MTVPDLPVFATPMGAAGAMLLKRLEEAGFAAYFVGGCVRDSLLGRPVKDIDIATSALPEQVMELFPNAVPTGIVHGTVTVPLSGWNYEVTTFRAESEYSDGRRPDSVSFIDDIRADLMRRDFTVNAMALDARGGLVDPFGGRSDLAAKRLRAVGNPAERFAEDALRMLRLVRFAAEYGFVPEEATWHEAKLGAPKLAAVAMERVCGELERMISGAGPHRALCLLRDSGLLRWTKTRLRLPVTLGLGDDPATDPLGSLPDITGDAARWALWFIRMELDGEEAERTCRALRMSAAFTGEVRRLLGLHRSLRGAPEESARKTWILSAVRYGTVSAESWLQLAKAVREYPDCGWLKPYADNGLQWLREMPVRSNRELDVNGNDLLALAGVRKGGPWLSSVLDKLTAEAASGELPNAREALLARARQLIALHGPGGGAAGSKKEGKETHEG